MNVRGFAIAPVARGKRGGNRRKGNIEGREIEEAEEETAAYCRARAGQGVQTDEIVTFAQRALQRRGVTQYFLVRHGVGSAEANSWCGRFLGRWGLERVRVNAQFRGRRGGHDIAVQIVRGWSECFQLLQRLDATVESGEVEYTLFGFDETNLRSVVARSMIIGQEQLEQFGGQQRRGAIPTEVLRMDCQVGVTLCSNAAVGEVPPMMVANGLPQHAQQVLLLLVFSAIAP